MNDVIEGHWKAEIPDPHLTEAEQIEMRSLEALAEMELERQDQEGVA